MNSRVNEWGVVIYPLTLFLSTLGKLEGYFKEMVGKK